MGKKRGARIPEFLCMGFQKCGTTTLFEILKQHPDAVLCRDVKEPMYYRVPGLWLIGHKWYYERRYYGHVSADDPRRCGEVNAGLTFSGCAKKIAHDFPKDTKLIFMMRNPVDRAYSSYKYFLARGFLPDGAVEDDLRYSHAKAFDRYVHYVLDDPDQESKIMDQRLKYLVFSQSKYASCIREYLQYFPKESIKFVFFEEFVSDEEEACREIFDFIGIRRDPDLKYSIRANEGTHRATASHAAKKFEIVKGFNYAFYEFLAMNSWAPNIYKRFKAYYEKVRRKTLVPDPDKSEMLPETRAFLEEYFAGEVQGVEEMSGRDLSGLWYPASDDRKKVKAGQPKDAA